MIGIAKIEMEAAHVFGEADGSKAAPSAWAERRGYSSFRGVVDERVGNASAVCSHVPVGV
jgi:hypothetical protein